MRNESERKEVQCERMIRKYYEEALTSKDFDHIRTYQAVWNNFTVNYTRINYYLSLVYVPRFLKSISGKRHGGKWWKIVFENFAHHAVNIFMRKAVSIPWVINLLSLFLPLRNLGANDCLIDQSSWRHCEICPEIKFSENHEYQWTFPPLGISEECWIGSISPRQIAKQNNTTVS